MSLPAHRGLHISMHNRLDAAGTSLEPEGHQGPRVPEPNLKNRDHFSAKSPRARLSLTCINGSRARLSQNSHRVHSLDRGTPQSRGANSSDKGLLFLSSGSTLT